MLGDASVSAMIPIRDRAVSREFYEKVLGLKLVKEDPMALEYDSGGAKIIVYETMVDITAQHTLATWWVKDVEAEVADLKSKGVTFEEYDLPGLKTENSIASDEKMGKAAWFKDPDGNILSVEESA